MNTQLAFAFGMLTMVAISMLVVIVLGMVKVMKLAKQVQYIQSELDRTVTHIYHRIEEQSSQTHIKFDNIERYLDGTVNRINDRFDETITNCNRRIDEEARNLMDEIHNRQRHVDSRFDKFENRIMTKVEPDMTALDVVIEKTKGKKQLLKD